MSYTISDFHREYGFLKELKIASDDQYERFMIFVLTSKGFSLTLLHYS